MSVWKSFAFSKGQCKVVEAVLKWLEKRAICRWWVRLRAFFTWGVPRLCGWSSWFSCTWTIKKNVEIERVVDKASVIFPLNRDAQNILIHTREKGSKPEKGWKQVTLMWGSYCFQLNKCLTWQLFKFQGFLISSVNLDNVCWWRPQCQFENLLCFWQNAAWVVPDHTKMTGENSHTRLAGQELFTWSAHRLCGWSGWLGRAWKK